MSELELLLSKVKELPALPQIYTRVTALLDDVNASVNKIGEAVQTEPSITSRILRMVNSAYYGLPYSVTSIPQTISLIGRERLKDILIGTLLAGLFRNIENKNFSMNDFWRHSIKTAIIARHIAMQSAHIIDHEALFTAGLLHDVGRLVIASKLPEFQQQIDTLVAEQGLDIIQAEFDILGFDHTNVSKALLQKWRLPDLLVYAVKNHHETDHYGPYADTNCIIYLANQLSNGSPPAEEEELLPILDKITNWQQAKCPANQILVAWHLAEDQAYDVMLSFGMTQ
jgi:putative nucleotidyltransferase with HDIG domain